jgi:hypothetical protein
MGRLGGSLVFVRVGRGDDSQSTRLHQRSRISPVQRRGRVGQAGYEAPGRRSGLRRKASSFPASLLDSDGLAPLQSCKSISNARGVIEKSKYTFCPDDNRLADELDLNGRDANRLYYIQG